MAVTLTKTPRAFTALVQDGKLRGLVPTPQSEAEYDEIAINAMTYCYDLHDVIAVDRSAALRLVARTIAPEGH
ncbi:hypothetical protein ACIQCR_16815 [Streptomyces sp. NPDC093249]|uniref:hypothetical protein n=1 Tax=unclassified Streptomyces TaxID=2593676 RepID=UPI00344FB21D